MPLYPGSQDQCEDEWPPSSHHHSCKPTCSSSRRLSERATRSFSSFCVPNWYVRMWAPESSS
jgi:hypothetical protein